MLRAKKRFGQNFLQDPQVINQIMQAIMPRADEHILEIGPGQGALTRALFKTDCNLSLVEIDTGLTKLLQAQFPRVKIYNEDILKTDLKSLLSPAGAPHKSRIVGNLPYNISTPLLFKLFEQMAQIQDLHFMLQREVVDRLCASPATPAYGRLTIMAGYYCHAEKLFEVPPDAFKPKPKVHSAMLRLSPQEERPAADPLILRAVVTQAFSQRRKTLRNALRPFLSESELEDAGIDPGLRPENLDLNQYVTCTLQVAKKQQAGHTLPRTLPGALPGTTH